MDYLFTGVMLEPRIYLGQCQVNIDWHECMNRVAYRETTIDLSDYKMGCVACVNVNVSIAIHDMFTHILSGIMSGSATE